MPLKACTVTNQMSSLATSDIDIISQKATEQHNITEAKEFVYCKSPLQQDPQLYIHPVLRYRGKPPSQLVILHVCFKWRHIAANCGGMSNVTMAVCSNLWWYHLHLQGMCLSSRKLSHKCETRLGRYCNTIPSTIHIFPGHTLSEARYFLEGLICGTARVAQTGLLSQCPLFFSQWNDWNSGKLHYCTKRRYNMKCYSTRVTA